MSKRERKQVVMEHVQKKMSEAGMDCGFHFPEYWKKRRSNLSVELLKQLQKTAEAEPEVTDAYGKYKTGTFLYKAFIVTVTRENGLWNVHIFGENPVTLPIIQEVRDRFVPDYCMMIHFFPSREEREALRGVMLVEMPGSVEEDKDEAKDGAENKNEEK